MTFADWLKSQPDPPSHRALARALGISHAYISLLKQQRRTPSIRVARRIAAYTKGAVPVDSWGAKR